MPPRKYPILAFRNFKFVFKVKNSTPLYDRMHKIIYLKIIARMPICDRQRPFSKKHNAIMHIFGQKTSFLTKTRVIYFKFCMKDPLLSYPYLVEKYQFCQFYSIVWPKKVNKMVFYPILHEKINARMPIFYQKYVYSHKKHTALKPI